MDSKNPGVFSGLLDKIVAQRKLALLEAKAELMKRNNITDKQIEKGEFEIVTRLENRGPKEFLTLEVVHHKKVDGITVEMEGMLRTTSTDLKLKKENV